MTINYILILNSSLPARFYLLGSVGVIYSGNYQEGEQHQND